MSLFTTTVIRCDLCTTTETLVGNERAAMLTWERNGWTRGSLQHGGGHTGYSHFCYICSSKPNFAELVRARRKAAAQPQGD